MLKRPRVLVFDEATSSLDSQTAERFAQTVNKLKGVATILFIAHQLPKGLAVDEVFTLIGEKATQMRLLEGARIGDSYGRRPFSGLQDGFGKLSCVTTLPDPGPEFRPS